MVVIVQLLTGVVLWQAVDGYKDPLPMYNDLFFYLFEECFSKLIDFERLVDPTWWVTPNGEPGESPFDCSFFTGDNARDILCGKLLQYLDFLVATHSGSMGPTRMRWKAWRDWTASTSQTLQ